MEKPDKPTDLKAALALTNGEIEGLKRLELQSDNETAKNLNLTYGRVRHRVRGRSLSWTLADDRMLCRVPARWNPAWWRRGSAEPLAGYPDDGDSIVPRQLGGLRNESATRHECKC